MVYVKELFSTFCGLEPSDACNVLLTSLDLGLLHLSLYSCKSNEEFHTGRDGQIQYSERFL